MIAFEKRKEDFITYIALKNGKKLRWIEIVRNYKHILYR